MKWAIATGLTSGVAVACHAQTGLELGAQRRVDVVMLGDSNQVRIRTGFEHGWAKALSSRYGLYATGVQWMGENGGGGIGAGYFCNTLGNAGAGVFEYGVSPFPPDPLNPAGSDLLPCGVLMLLSGDTLTSVGMTLDAPSPYFRLGDRLEFRGVYRTLGPAAGLSPLVRLASPPYTVRLQGPTISHVPGIRETVLTYIPMINEPLDFKFGQRTFAPYETYFAHMTNLERSTGAAVTTLYANGGRSARDCAASLLAVDDELIATVLGALRDRQGHDRPRLLIRLAFGLNDLVETEPSVVRGYEGPSAQAYEDNMRAIMDRFDRVALANHWPLDEIEFVLTLPHSVTTQNDARIREYVAVARGLESARVRVIDLSEFYTEQELDALGYFDSPGDHFHLLVAGYEALAALEVSEILGERCRADVTHDGGVDADDVVAFFVAWDRNLSRGDFNHDGGVDGDDLIAFFERWDAGC